MIRYIGAGLIVVSCGGCGFGMAAAFRREEHTLRQLLSATEFMSCELQYRRTPLPELCAGAGRLTGGAVGKVFSALSDGLLRQDSPSVSVCMGQALAQVAGLSISSRQLFSRLGDTLGLFDLPGQQRGFAALQDECRRLLEEMARDRAGRLRSYQTLGLCAGAALVILFI